MQSLEWSPDCGAESARLSSPGPGDLIWADALTGTCWHVRQTVAQAALAPAVAELQRLPAQEIYQALTAGELPPKAFRLPASPGIHQRPGDRPPASAWLVDRVLIRTGIFAALVGGPSRPDWPELRKAALLWGLDQYPREPDPEALPMAPDLRAALAAADRLAVGREDVALPPGPGVDLVKGGVVKVKQYLLETSRIRAIRGASTLLDNINLARLPALFHTAPFTPEMIVYAGGGHLLAIVPAGEGPGLARQIERLYERVTVSAQCAAASLHIPRARLHRVRACLDDLEMTLSERQMSRLPVPVTGYPDPDIQYMAQPGGVYSTGGGNPASGERCTYCGIRPVSWAIYDEQLCTSCRHKYIAGRSERTRLFAQYASRAGLPPDVSSPQTLEDLAGEEGDIAVFYGDGNNMGQIVLNLRSLAEYRHFSRRTEYEVTRATFQALKQNGVTKVEFVALGGDDLFFITPARGALSVARDLGSLFDQAFANRTPEVGGPRTPITMSVGVVIAHSHTPIRNLFELVAGSLLPAAKRAARAAASPSGTVDILTLTGGQLPEDLENRRRHTLRPFTWEQASAFVELAATVARSQTWSTAGLYSLRDAITRMSRAEADLYYRYQVARLFSRPDKARQWEDVERALERLAGTYGAEVEGPFFRRGSEYLTPWIDLVELMPYRKGGEDGAAQAER